MDIATLLGLLIAAGIVLAAILQGGSILLFINVPSIMIVIGGTLGVVMARFTLGQLIGSIKVGMKALLYKSMSSEDLIEKGVEMAQVVRKEGVLALENMDIDNPFLKMGVNMCLDNVPPEDSRRMLSKEINLTIERHEGGMKVFKDMGDAAPALGMIGTLIGLVQMLANMSDPAAIGPAMAVALLTTLYGAMIANMFAFPIMDKLALRNDEERLHKVLILETIAGIQEGMQPRVLEQLLNSFLPESKRKIDEG